MAAFTNVLEDRILNSTLRGSAWTAIASVYVALSTTPTDDTGAITEPSGVNNYTRKAVTFAAPSGGAVSNSADVTFNQATPGGWGTITHMAIYDASSGGNMLYQGPLAASKTVNAGDTFRFQIGQLTVSLD